MYVHVHSIRYTYTIKGFYTTYLIHTHTHTYTHIFIYIYIYIFIGVRGVAHADNGREDGSEVECYAEPAQ